jgi:hypothetical protein
MIDPLNYRVPPHMVYIPRQLRDMPEHGRVVIAHPESRHLAFAMAGGQGLNFMLTDAVQPRSVYILDVDEFSWPLRRR